MQTKLLKFREMREHSRETYYCVLCGYSFGVYDHRERQLGCHSVVEVFRDEAGVIQSMSRYVQPTLDGVPYLKAVSKSVSTEGQTFDEFCSDNEVSVWEFYQSI